MARSYACVWQAQKLSAASLRGRELVSQTRASLRAYGMKGKDGVLAEVCTLWIVL